MAEVVAAADALLAAGDRPTVERVRLKIGRGSPNTLYPMLDAWYASLGERLGLAGAQSAGSTPPTARAALDAVWKAAVGVADGHAQEALAAEKEALAQQRAELAASQTQLHQERAALQAREAAAEQTISVLKGQLDDRVQEIERQRAHLDRSAAELGAARATLARMAMEQDAERRKLAGMVEEQMRNVKQLQDMATATERRLLEDVDRARQATKQVQQALAGSEKALAQDRQLHTAQLDKLRGQLRDVELLLATTRERLAASDRQLVELRQAHPKPAKRPAKKKSA
jgi:hypothetical protein